jgi:hypothetical protein
MLKKLLLLIFIFNLLIIVPPAKADFNSLNQEYTQNLSDNNAALNDYKIAKNTYETYYTLSALTQVLEKSKTYMQTRDNLIIKHFNLLNAKLDMTEMSAEQKDSLKGISDSEITFFENHLTLIQSISTINDINTISGKAESEIKNANIKSKQILGNILVGKVNSLLIPYATLMQDTEKEIGDLKSRNLKPQTTIDKLERWLVEVKNKKILTENNIAQNLSDLSNLGKNSGQDIDKQFDVIRINIIQSQLYLKEGTNFISEILDEIKYQN